MPDLLEGWRSQLSQDLRGFADRGSEPTFEIDGNTLRAAWQVRGKEQDALFSLQAGGQLRWASGPRGDEPYSAFLASDAMADFPQLASAYLATIAREDDFVPLGIHRDRAEQRVTITDDSERFSVGDFCLLRLRNLELCNGCRAEGDEAKAGETRVPMRLASSGVSVAVTAPIHALCTCPYRSRSWTTLRARSTGMAKPIPCAFA